MLKTASLFKDGAVLCRRKEIRIFGEADNKAEVTATLYDRNGMLLAKGRGQAREGRFLVLLKPQEALVLTLFGKYVGTLKEEGFYFPTAHQKDLR